MSRQRGNAVRKERSRIMASPVQEIVSMPPGIVEQQEKQKTMSVPTHYVAPNRAIAPAALLGFLLLCFLVSPYLPTGVREYISALVR